MKSFIEFEFSKENSKIAPNWRVFWTSLIPMFLIVSLNILGVKKPVLINPLLEEIKNEEIVQKKLQEKPNNYSLQEDINFNSFVTTTYASQLEADKATGYAIVDFDNGHILQEKAVSQKLPIASLTKVMSAVVALDLAEESDEFTVTPTAASIIPTKIMVIPGERMQLAELLHASLLSSANDATEVIKEGIDNKYGKGTFIKSMNAKARFLGLTNTHFSNAQGFDNPYNYSSPHDLALLSHYALTNYPLIAEIAKKEYEFLPQNSTHHQHNLYNWNGLLGVYPNVMGLKIGNTDDAGTTTIVVAEREGKKILVVLLGAPGVFERDLWAAELLNTGFSQTLGLEPMVVTKEDLQAKYDTWHYGN